MGNNSSSIKVSEIKTIDDELLRDLPKDISFFEPFLHHEVKEALEVDGETFVSQDPQGKINGLFIYDGYEATGTVFTKSKEVFDYFYELKPSSYIFSELEIPEHSKGTWNIWQLDVEKVSLDHRFKHFVTMESNVAELERFMASTQPETNRKWARVALLNGDKCFVTKMAHKIVGIAWMTIAHGVARSHGLYVEPQFRRMGVMTDNLQARLIYLKSRRVHTLVNEISEENIASAAHAAKAGEKIVGKIFLYTSPPP